MVSLFSTHRQTLNQHSARRCGDICCETHVRLGVCIVVGGERLHQQGGYQDTVEWEKLMLIEFESRAGVTGSIRWIQTLTYQPVSTTQNFEIDDGLLLLSARVGFETQKHCNGLSVCRNVSFVAFQQFRIREL
jgi:hypothetical protein